MDERTKRRIAEGKVFSLKKHKEIEERKKLEEERLAALMPRLENWYRVYRDSRQRQISATHRAMLYLIETFGYPPEMETAPSQEILEETDNKDAAILEYVYSTMGGDWEADEWINGRKNLTVSTAKTIIRLLCFEDRYTFNFARRHYFKISGAKYNAWIRDALLFFDARLRVYEWAKSQDKK
jgi:hypothetical protein